MVAEVGRQQRLRERASLPVAQTGAEQKIEGPADAAPQIGRAGCCRRHYGGGRVGGRTGNVGRDAGHGVDFFSFQMAKDGN